MKNEINSRKWREGNSQLVFQINTSSSLPYEFFIQKIDFEGPENDYYTIFIDSFSSLEECKEESFKKYFEYLETGKIIGNITLS